MYRKKHHKRWMYSLLLLFGFIFLGMLIKINELNQMNLTTNSLIISSTEKELPSEQSSVRTASTFLIKNTDPEIKKLIQSYYQALLTADETLYRSITTDTRDLDVNVILRKMEYIEDYQIKDIYITQGMGHAGLVAYVVYDLKINSIKTPAPSIDQFLIQNTKHGTKLYFNSLTDQEQALVEKVKAHKEVQHLIDTVSINFKTAIASDSDLSDFYIAVSSVQ